MVRDPRGGYNRKRVNEDFFKVWSPKMSYVLGFMFADGSLIDSNESSRTYYLSFVNNDLEVLEKIRNLMDSNHRIYYKPPHIMEHTSKKYHAKPGYVLRLGNKIMYNNLLCLGMTHRKSNTMCLPNVPRTLFSYFLRGYFDGDGCVNLSLPAGRITPRVRLIFTSGSVAFLSEISALLAETLNIMPPHYYQSSGAYNLMISGSSACIALEFLYSNLDRAPYLKRKYQKYLEYKNSLMGPRVRKSLVIT